MKRHKYTDLIIKLENEELNNNFPEDSLYIELLALYLYENNLKSAEFLWRRIPQNIKALHTELGTLNHIRQSMKTNNNIEFFRNINCAWPENLKVIIEELKDKNMVSLFDLVENSYSSVYGQNLMDLTKLSRDKLQTICQPMGWTLTRMSEGGYINPRSNVNRYTKYSSSETELFTLTEFVSFLES